MGLKSFAVEQKARLLLRDASDNLMYADEAKTKPIAVNVFGPGSKQYQAAQARQSNRAIERLRKNKKIDLTPEEKLAENAEFLAEITDSFENVDAAEFGNASGKALAVAIYSDLSIGFIADQVAKYTADWANFSKPSTSN